MPRNSGGCLCGDVRFEFDGEPRIQAVCHCHMCQRASGSAFMPLLFIDKDALTLVQGEPRAFQSSATLIRHFCPNCGSPVFIERTSSSRYGVLVGALDDSSVFKPTMHICFEASQGWLELADALPRYEEKPAGMTPTLNYNVATGRVTEKK